MLPLPPTQQRLQRLHDFVAKKRGFSIRCLRFTNRVTSAHARLASGWLAHLCREGVEPSGLLRKVSGSLHPFPLSKACPDASWAHALRWAMDSPAGQPAYWASRLGLVRRFAEYRSSADPRTEVPPLGLLPHSYRRKSPYVYSDDDIQKLITEAQQLRSPKGLRATTFYTLFGLLAVAGLRISECLTLDRQDVDLAEGTPASVALSGQLPGSCR